MDVRVGRWRKLSTEELMLLTCGVEEDSWESLDCKKIQQVHPKGDQSWGFIGRTDVDAETPILWPPHAKSWLIDWKRPWCWEGLGAGGEGDNRGWDWLDGITEPTDMGLGGFWELVMDREARHAQFMESQRVGHGWVTELNW